MEKIILIQSDTTKTIKVNKQILSDNSEYFKKLFNNNFIESTKTDIKLIVDDIVTAKTLIKVLQDREYEIDFSNVDIFKLLDLGDYWLCVDIIVNACYDEIAEHIQKYDINQIIVYMDKYDMYVEDSLDVIFYKCKIIDIVKLLEKHNVQPKSSFFQQCIKRLIITMFDHDLDEVFDIIAKYNPTISELYFNYSRNIHNLKKLWRNIVRHSDKIRISSSFVAKFSKYMTDNNVYDVVDKINLCHYIVKSGYSSLLSVLQQLWALNCKKILNDKDRISKLKIGSLQQYCKGYYNSYVCIKYTELCQEKFDYIWNNSTDKSHTANYIINKIIKYELYDVVSIQFLDKLREYVSVEGIKGFLDLTM